MKGLRAFCSGEYADLQLLCGGRALKAHRVVIGTQSKPLADRIESGSKEAKICTINLEDDKLPILKLLIEYFYTGNYRNPVLSGPLPANNGSLSEEIKIHEELYDMANKYEVPGLRHCITEKYKKYLDGSLQGFIASLEEIRDPRHPMHGIRAVAIGFAMQNYLRLRT
ncbi:hypothetical protein BJ875DRAFT_14595 [Amylocarpus encephaloides]|uniref:BTB domain-containing protein n=1 Tax=Amylocarpus encephaloides TaxID=45428 RepID=A0A9P7YRS6_9HELO|nr:hypothetical protein BJ875DRAFT_14595 [Amylocarpus encephaloides]